MLGTSPNMDHVQGEYKAGAVKSLAIWHKMRPLTVPNFQYFWNLDNPDVLMTDTQKAEFTTWTGVFGEKYEGMRVCNTGNMQHGVMRLIDRDIWECSP